MKITDEMLYQHAAEARDLWLDTMPKGEEIPEHRFSEDFLASLENMKQQEKTRRKRPGYRILRHAAAVFLVILLGSGTWLGTNVEARAAFAGWFKEFVGNSVRYSYAGDVPEENIAAYRCSWLPEGVEAAEVEISDTSGHVIYTSQDDDFAVFSYSYMHSGTALHLFPTEEEMVHSVMQINGMRADFYEEPGENHSCFIIWFDEENRIFFDINSNMSKADTIGMAQSVQQGLALQLMPQYTCTWLPDGYHASELSRGSRSRTISCLKGQNHIRLDYEYQQGRSAGEVFRVEEYSQRKTVSVQGNDAVLYLNTQPGEHTLVWADVRSGIAFCLASTENEETMLLVAEAIKKK